jgi:hypothetical protein
LYTWEARYNIAPLFPLSRHVGGWSWRDSESSAMAAEEVSDVLQYNIIIHLRCSC